jgi:hypothetical protein
MLLLDNFRQKLDIAENLLYMIEAYTDHIEDVNEEIRIENKHENTNVPELELWPEYIKSIQT